MTLATDSNKVATLYDSMVVCVKSWLSSF